MSLGFHAAVLVLAVIASGLGDSEAACNFRNWCSSNSMEIKTERVDNIYVS